MNAAQTNYRVAAWAAMAAAAAAQRCVDAVFLNRFNVIAIVLLASAAVLALTIANPRPTRAARAVTLIYVGAENCAPCDRWQRDQGSAFRRSAAFRQITYRQVKSGSLRDVLSDEAWPEDLRRYRAGIGKRAAVPLWLVVADEELVLQGFGAQQWREDVLPAVRALLRGEMPRS